MSNWIHQLGIELTLQGPPPKDWDNLHQIADDLGCSLVTARIAVNKAIKAGKVESKRFRQKTASGQFKPVLYYHTLK